MTLLLTGGHVVPCDGTRTLHEDGAVLVDGDRIVAVGPVAQVEQHPLASAPGTEVVDCTDHVVLPGLVNAHLHSGLLRGTAESMSLWDWLRTYVDPAHKALTPEISEAASLLCYSESVLAGTTSVLDMWRFPERSAAVAGRLGIRATLAPYVADEPEYDYFETLATNRAALEACHGDHGGRVRVWVGLEHLMYCSEQCFRDAAALAEEFDTGIHTHSSETLWEVQESLTRWGRRPLHVMHQRGVLGPRTVVAHCVWLDDQEIEVLAATGTAVAHCPCSNMKLASGPARVGALRAAGVTVGLGSDGEKENNDLDLFGEMKAAALLEKVSTLDPMVGDPWTVLQMATVEGARALGLEAVTGSLEVGKRADVVVASLRGLHTTPVLRGSLSNVVAHLVFSSTGRDVRDVWVDGRPAVRDRRLVAVDEADVRTTAQAAAEELFERRSHLEPPLP